MSHRSVTRLVAHVVWSTKDRQPSIDASRQEWLSTAITDAARRHGATVLAAGVVDDHVHVLLRWAETHALSTIVGRLKGASSRIWNLTYGNGSSLDWQDGFWAETCEPEPPLGLIEYVRRQREHHAGGSTDVRWEPTLEGFTLSEDDTHGTAR